MNIKDIATTLALLGTGPLVMAGCGKEQPATEVPGGEGAAGGDEGAAGDGAAGEASCSGDGHTAEGHCGGDEGVEGSASCSDVGSEGEHEVESGDEEPPSAS